MCYIEESIQNMSKKIQTTQFHSLKFIHITDSHLLDNADERLHDTNTKQSFETVLMHCQQQFPNIDFILLTGDISQTGSIRSYTLFKTLIAQSNVPIYGVPGNHDNPKLLQKVLPITPDDSINVIQFGKFSLILISSWVDNAHHGMVSKFCLNQLENYLQSNINQFPIIAVHHPPVSIESKWLDEIALINKDELIQILNDSFQTPLLLFGHVHQEIDIQLNKIRILGTPSTCYQFQPNSTTMKRANTPPPSYRYVKLSIPNSVETIVYFV